MVSLVEIAIVLNTSAAEIEREARELGMRVESDWKGDPCLTAADAKAIVDGSARRQHDHEVRLADLRKRDQDWQRRQRAAATEAVEKVRAQQQATHLDPNQVALNPLLVASRARSQQAAARTQAVTDFEKAEPRPRFGEDT